MNCSEARVLANASLDAELGTCDKATLDAHLAQCPRCSAYLQAFASLKVRLSRTTLTRNEKRIAGILERSMDEEEDGGEGEKSLLLSGLSGGGVHVPVARGARGD
jgi:anti-sigma factor RsiW